MHGSTIGYSQSALCVSVIKSNIICDIITSRIKSKAIIRPARQHGPATNCQDLTHHWHGLAVDEMPRTGLFCVHQVHHLILVSLIVISDPPVTPGGTRYSEAALAIATPGSTIVIYTEIYEIGFGYLRWAIVNTVHGPPATVTPSDDATYVRVARIISCYSAIEKAIIHIHNCFDRMSYDTASVRIR